MLKAALQEEDIRSPEPVVLIASERKCVVDVLSTQRLLKIKRHNTRCRIDRLRDQQSEANRAVQITCAGNLGTSVCGGATFVWTGSNCVVRLRRRVAIQIERMP